MIALKLIAQSLAGVGAVVTCVGGGVYGMTKSATNSFTSPTNSSNKLSLFSYYLVSATKETEDVFAIEMWSSNKPIIKTPSDPSTQEEWTEFWKNQDARLNQKNYTCKFIKDAIDDSCVIFNITANDENVTIDLEKIKEFITSNEKSTDKIYKTPSDSFLEGIEFFLLRVSNDKKKLIKTDGTTSIDLLSLATDAPDKGRSYVKLTVHAEINETKAEGKVNFLIAKVVDEQDQQTILASANKITHKCHLKSKPEDKKSCNIVELSPPNSVTDKENIIFKDVAVPTTQTSLTLSPGKFFLISLSEESNYWSSNLEEQSIVFSETTTTTSSPTTIKSTELKIVSPIFVLIKEENKISQVLIN